MNNLKRLVELTNKLSSTSSTNEKKSILKEYEDCKKLLYYTFNDFKKFNIKSSNLKKLSHLSFYAIEIEDLFDLLDKLSNREITGHDAIATTNAFINDNKEYADIIYKIIDKSLECRISSSIINKVWDGLIPVFDVALADGFEKHKKSVDFNKDRWFASHKLDGCRCIAIVNDNKINFYSRKGIEFATLDKIAKELAKYENLNGKVLDGEICIVDENGVEDFTSIMKVIKKKDYIIENPKYKVFDIIELDDFLKKESSSTLSERQKILQSYNFSGNIETLKQIEIEHYDHLEELISMSNNNDWEGLIIRKDSTYKGKRSKEMLKIKSFFDAEYKVLSTENNDMQIVVNNEEVTETLMSNVVIEHKGFMVRVGSGFNLEQRRKFFKNPELIIGKIITVQFFEETTNKAGGISLRFPTVKIIHGEKRDT